MSDITTITVTNVEGETLNPVTATITVVGTVPAGPPGATGATGPAGAEGDPGPAGADGEGVPTGGTTGQVLAKATDDDFDTEWVEQTGGPGGGSVSDDAYGVGWDGVTDTAPSQNAVYDKLEAVVATILTTEQAQDLVGAMVAGGTETGLAVTYDDTNGRLDFVAEVTTAILTAALALKADLASPALTGNPTATTQAPGSNNTRLATTEFVAAALTAVIGTAPGVLDTLGEIADAINDDANLYTTLVAAIAAKVSDTAYNEATWNGDTTVAPSKNAVRDALEALAAAIAAAYQPLDGDLTTLAGAGNSAVLAATTASFLTADETKLDGIEAGADVTDAANVAAAGAAMQAQNLADLDDIPTARDNLGIVTASAARVYKSSGSQTIATATHTAVTLDAEEFDDDGQHFTSAANLTGTVAKAASSATLTGTGTAFTTELSVGQVIDVPGTAVERRVVTAIASNTSLTVNTAYANTATGQTGVRVNSTFTILESGRYRLYGQVSWTVDTATGIRQLTFWQNGVATGTRKGQSSVTSHATSNQRQELVSGVVALNQWDYVEMSAYQDSGGNRSLSTGAIETWVCIERAS